MTNRIFRNLLRLPWRPSMTLYGRGNAIHKPFHFLLGCIGILNFPASLHLDKAISLVLAKCNVNGRNECHFWAGGLSIQHAFLKHSLHFICQPDETRVTSKTVSKVTRWARTAWKWVPHLYPYLMWALYGILCYWDLQLFVIAASIDYPD